MKNFFLFIVLVNAIMFSYAGKNSNERRRSEDINQLHLIKEAERCVLLKDYAKATILYKQAFKVNVKPYANNCFIAAQVSAVCNEFEDFIFLQEKFFSQDLIIVIMKGIVY